MNIFNVLTISLGELVLSLFLVDGSDDEQKYELDKKPYPLYVHNICLNFKMTKFCSHKIATV